MHGVTGHSMVLFDPRRNEDNWVDFHTNGIRKYADRDPQDRRGWQASFYETEHALVTSRISGLLGPLFDRADGGNWGQQVLDRCRMFVEEICVLELETLHTIQAISTSPSTSSSSTFTFICEGNPELESFLNGPDLAVRSRAEQGTNRNTSFSECDDWTRKNNLIEYVLYRSGLFAEAPTTVTTEGSEW